MTKALTSRRIEPLSSEDRDFLEHEATQADRTGTAAQVWMVLFSAFVAVVYASVAVFVAGLLARLVGYPISKGAWRNDPVTYYGAIAVGCGVLLFLAVSYVRWWLRASRDKAAYIRSVAEDIASDRVSVEDHDVLAVKLLQDPEHHAFIFLLRLSNGKTLVLYDYDSFDSENDFPADNQPTLVPCERISLRTFPRSQRRRWAFSGAQLPLPTAIELALGPEKWPDDETWCKVKWENIERHYGPKKPRQAAASSRS